MRKVSKIRLVMFVSFRLTELFKLISVLCMLVLIDVETKVFFCRQGIIGQDMVEVNQTFDLTTN